jgi:hypothetical protein
MSQKRGGCGWAIILNAKPSEPPEQALPPGRIFSDLSLPRLKE